MDWMLDNRPAVRAAGERLAFGTIDSWLIWKLTGGAVHATDATNASRTMLMALDGSDWDERAVRPVRRSIRRSLPRIVDSAGPIGTTDPRCSAPPIPICGSGRRPAGGDHRPGLPQAGRHQGDLRHRRLRPLQQRRRAAPFRPTACCRPSSARSAASAAMRWKAACSSPAA